MLLLSLLILDLPIIPLVTRIVEHSILPCFSIPMKLCGRLSIETIQVKMLKESCCYEVCRSLKDCWKASKNSFVSPKKQLRQHC